MNSSRMQRDFNAAPVYQRENIYRQYANIYQTVDQNISRDEDRAQRRCLFAMERILNSSKPWLNIEYSDLHPTPQSNKNKELAQRLRRSQSTSSASSITSTSMFGQMFINLCILIVWLPFHALKMMALALLHINDIYRIRSNPRAYRRYARTHDYQVATAWLYAALTLILCIISIIAWS